MSDWRPLHGATLPTAMNITPDGSKLQIKEVQHSDQLVVDHVANMGREIREHGRRKRESALGHYVGSIPLAVYNQWLKEDPELKHDGRKLAAKLKEAQFSKLRVSP